MRWQRLTIWVALLLAWSAVVAWQLHEYGHECELAEEAVCRQADALMNALVGGIQSHRRLGFFFEEQIQGILSGLVRAEDVLAVAVTSEEDQLLLYAPREATALLKEKAGVLGTTPQKIPDESWDAAGFWRVARFRLAPYGGGRYPGDERPGGRGYGRGLRWQVPDRSDPEGPFSEGGRFAAILLLDRTRADDQRRRAAWRCASVAAASVLVLFCVALAWRATVRAAQADGRARLLETEARHLRELNQAAAGLAHETRNPLGLIRGWTQRLAKSASDSPEQEQRAKAVVEECDRVTARINQFLAFARPCEPKLAPVDAAEVVDELAVLLEPDLDAKNLTLRRVGLGPGETLQADRELLRQALFNLVQNAVQSAPEGGTVEMALHRGQDGERRIEVADGGPGVPPEAVDSLFTPYYTTRPNGTGLGLAIVRRIATSHGWEAGYAPRPGGGSIFWLDRIHG